MIPKKIHYFWFGHSKSILGNICINSWKEKLPDYEIIEWNETNIDIKAICDENRFFKECYKRKLYAYMVDYLRLKILYDHGGVYMDTDVQVIKDFTELLNNRGIIGMEAGDFVGTGLIACEAKDATIKRILDFYQTEIWNSTLITIPQIITDIYRKDGLGDFKIYPMEYFSPYNYKEGFDYSVIKDNTYTIHWYSGSWISKLSNIIFLNTKSIKNRSYKFLVTVKCVLGFYKVRLRLRGRPEV